MSRMIQSFIHVCNTFRDWQKLNLIRIYRGWMIYKEVIG